MKPPIKHIISIGTPQPDKVLMVSGVQVVLKYIPSGEYWMGSFEEETGHLANEIAYKVKLTQGFYMMSTPVTQNLYQAVMGTNPSRFKGGECPVERVSWADAQGFASKVSALMGGIWTLPTEAQWEWAARGGEEYVYAGSNDPNEVGWYGDNSGRTTHPVQQKKPNGLGLYDMSGNIWEWTTNRYGDYPASGGIFEADSHVDPQGNESGAYRVLRGGSWGRNAPSTRVAIRGGNAPGSLYEGHGFRLVRS